MLKSTTLMPLISLNPATTEIKLQIHFVRTLPPLEKFISPLEMPPLPAGMQGLLLARESLCAAFTSFYWEVTSIVLLLCVHQVQIYDWYMVEIELNSYTVKQMVLYFLALFLYFFKYLEQFNMNSTLLLSCSNYTTNWNFSVVCVCIVYALENHWVYSSVFILFAR